MLAILGNGGHGGAPLSADDERLLDHWSDGRLAADADAAARATMLVRRNALAAERLLERRLLALAARAPAPPALSAATWRLALPTPPLPTAPLRARRPWIFLPGRWFALTGGLVLASVLAVAGVPLLRDAMRGDVPLQLALVSIADRGPLFEPSDIRMRGGERAPVPATERRFRDLEVPAGVLQGLFPQAAPPSAPRTQDIESLLALGPRRDPARVLVDATLRARADASSPDALLPVRLYDLDDPRAAPLRAALGVSVPADRKVFFLTARP